VNDVLTYHTRFSPEEFESQYNLRLGRPDYEETVIPDWVARSKLARENLNCTLDIRYGDGPKQMYDVFNCGSVEAPVLIYFHGGYWQRGDKSIYSFLAEPFIAAGVNVVVVGYDLCPDVSITEISEQAREAVSDIYRKANELGLNQKKLAIMGHSAGGHITEMMMGTNWSMYAKDLPVDLINVGIPISPLSLLEPVRLTAGLNTGIRMNEAEAESQSPVINHPPVTNASQMVVVGGVETDEFHRQAQMYVDKFKSKERAMELYVVPGVDHFDELNVLADPNSPFFKNTLAIIS